MTEPEAAEEATERTPGRDNEEINEIEVTNENWKICHKIRSIYRTKLSQIFKFSVLTIFRHFGC